VEVMVDAQLVILLVVVVSKPAEYSDLNLLSSISCLPREHSYMLIQLLSVSHIIGLMISSTESSVIVLLRMLQKSARYLAVKLIVHLQVEWPLPVP
jgi:hypothetical protein